MTRTSLSHVQSANRPGASLIELLVVLGIIGVLAAMGMAVVNVAYSFADNLRAEVDAARMTLRHSKSNPARPTRSKAGFIPDQYVIVLADSADPNVVAARLRQSIPLQVISTFRSTKGFVASLPAASLSILLQDPDVRFIDQDFYMHPSQFGNQIIPMGVTRIGGGRPSNLIVGTNTSVTGSGLFTETTTKSGDGMGLPITIPNTIPMTGFTMSVTTGVAAPSTASTTRPTIGFPFFSNNNLVANLVGTVGTPITTSEEGAGVINIGMGAGQTITTNGINVNLVIIDTGVQRHRDLLIIEDKSRFITEAASGLTGPSNFVDTTNGHGTLMAGIAAARDNDVDVVGVAPGAKIWACRAVLAGSSINSNELDNSIITLGSMSNIYKAVDALTKMHETAITHNDKPHVAYIGFTASGPATSLLNSAIEKLVEAGTVVVVPAGNNEPAPNLLNAANVVPANCKAAITVGAMVDLNGADAAVPTPPPVPAFLQPPYTSPTYPLALTQVFPASPGGTPYTDETIASFSNRNVGPDPANHYVDLLAPGVEIQSTFFVAQVSPGSNIWAGVRRCTGTSVAAAHVAGMACLALDPDARMSGNIVNGRSIFNSLGYGIQTPTPVLPNSVQFLMTNFHPYRSIDELFNGFGTMAPNTGANAFPNNGRISGIPVANARLF